MILSRLAVHQFRTYEEIAVEFPRGLVVIVGENAQGKSTLLEAAYMAVTGASPRTHNDKEVIRWGESLSWVRTTLQSEGGVSQVYEVIISPEGKKFRVDGVERKGAKLWASPFGAVCFLPEDLRLIAGEPKQRRDFLDAELSHLSKSYYFNLLHYRRALAHRNVVLKELSNKTRSPHTHITHTVDSLCEWDEQVIKYGVRVLVKRLDFMALLSERAASVHKELTGGREELELVYWSTVLDGPALAGETNEDEWESRFRARLEGSLTNDVKMQVTHVGPHRDELLIRANGFNLRSFGSLGQQRTAALSLRLGLAQVYEVSKSEPPLLLLDDVMSQIDLARRRHVIDRLSSLEQVFISSTEAEAVPKSAWERCTFYRVHAGHVVHLR